MKIRCSLVWYLFLTGILIAPMYAQNASFRGDALEKRVYAGSFLSAQFINDFFIEFLPFIEYKVWKNMRIGGGGLYRLALLRMLDGNNQIQRNAYHFYGAQGYLNYTLLGPLSAHMEGGWINFRYSSQGTLSDRVNRALLWIGVGLRLPFRRMAVHILGIYNVLHRQNTSPYPQIFNIRLGVSVGLGSGRPKRQ